MQKRRGRGEGAIYRREQDGLWCSLLNVGYLQNGKRKRRYIYGKTKKEVQQKLLALQKDLSNGIAFTPSRMTVGEFLDHWLETVAKPLIKKSTHASYELIIRVHIKPDLGGAPVRNLQSIHVQNFLHQMRVKGKGERTCQLVFVILKTAMVQAVKWGLTNKNPCDGIAKPRVTQSAMKFWTPDQIKHFLSVAKKDEFYALYVLAVTTGLRQGELFGLKWSDFNERNNSLAIQRTIYEINGDQEIGEPKTASGRRKIDLPIVAVNALEQHRAAARESRKSDWIFSDSNGEPLRRSNFRKRSFLKLLVLSKLPKIRFHDLRHSAATLLLSKAVHPKIVQERLGHSQISVTLDTYSHVLPSLQKEAVAKIDELLDDDVLS